jgi:RecA-family ATPase
MEYKRLEPIELKTEPKLELKMVPNETPDKTVLAPLPSEAEAEPPLSSPFSVASKVYTAREYIANTSINLVPIVESLIYEKTLNMVVGRAKGGKSTFIRYLIKCVADGDDFLNHATSPAKILYLPLDEPAALIKIGIQKVNIENLDDIHITKLEESNDDLDHIVKICLEGEIKLVVVDLISKIMDVEDTNKYGEVSKSLRRFREISDEHNISFIFLHHSTKSNPKSVLGSQSIAGAMDNIIYITDNDGKYFYESEGRFENIEKTEILLNPDNNHLSVHELHGLTEEEAILHVIEANEELSKNAAAKLVKRSKEKTLKLIDKLKDEQKLTLTENGKYRVTNPARKETK